MTTIEPGIYLLSACSLSFKPLFRMFAKALHIQAFITHTKSTFQPGGKSTKLATATQNDVPLKGMPGAPPGRFYRLSEESERSGGKRMEVLVTTTVDVESDEDEWRASEETRVGVGRRDGGNVV